MNSNHTAQSARPYVPTTRSAGIADELGLTEPGLTEIRTNPLYAGRAVRRKGRPDEEEQPARFPPPVDPALFDRVQALRGQRRPAHPAGGGSFGRRLYPLVRLMRCMACGSRYHGDAGNGTRRVRHSIRPACAPSATYRAGRYESQVADRLNRIRFADADTALVLAAMRRAAPTAEPVPPIDTAAARAELQRLLSADEIGLSAFNWEWRRLDRPVPSSASPAPVDELRPRRASGLLERFGDLWAEADVPGELRQEAAHELFERIDVHGPDVLALAPTHSDWAATRDRPRPDGAAAEHGFSSMRPGQWPENRDPALAGSRCQRRRVAGVTRRRPSGHAG